MRGLCLRGRMAQIALAVIPALLAGWLAAAQVKGPAAPASVIDLQPDRQVQSVSITDRTGRIGTVTLNNLQPAVNAWFVLGLQWHDARDGRAWHLENAHPAAARIRLAADGSGILIATPAGEGKCDLRIGNQDSVLDQARRSGLPWVPLCEDRVLIRNPVAGRVTLLERMTAFLRDHVWGGDRIVGFVREQLYQDAFVERSGSVSDSPGEMAAPAPADAPRLARVAAAFAGRALLSGDLGIVPPQTRMGIGQWVGVPGLAGVHASVMLPGAVPQEILASHSRVVAPLDAVEAQARVYLVAFDLARFETAFAVGTDHPRVGWSPRVPPDMRRDSPRGPDGIDTIAPLVGLGMVSPPLVRRVVATFTGGFKREHSAFQYGDLARVNGGTHYGVIEQGVVLSRLQPGLATFFVDRAGAVSMKTWMRADDAMLPRLVHARQNGVPLVETDPAGTHPVAGALVAQWGPGNWSGSDDGKLRSLRAALCLQSDGVRRHLIHAWFSTATPSAMAQVLRAYECAYAMHLDMNALEHTYLAVYVRQGEQVAVLHLVRGMAVLDQQSQGQWLPRFLGFPDNRDFFYLLQREGGR